MHRDNHPFLNDYLDGRLEAQHQHAIETNCLTNPRLAEDLRELAVVRDLVAGLSRDHRVNLATRVMEQVRASRRRKRKAFSLRGPRPLIAAIGGGLAIAASLMAVTTTLWSPRGPVDQASNVAPMRRPALDEPPAVAGPVGQEVVASPRAASALRPDPPRPGPNLVVTAKAAPAVEPPSTTIVPEETAPSTRTIEELTRLLDHRNLRQIFVVSDSKDGSAQQRVASLVEQTTHFDYFTITVAQGLVIDPMHPDQATVFALIIDPTELGKLKEQLKAAAKSPVTEQEATPEIITQLADLGDIKSLKPSVPEPVMIPRSEIAFRATPANPQTEEPADPERDGMTSVVAKMESTTPVPPADHSTLPSSLQATTADRVPPYRAVTSRHRGRLGKSEKSNAFDPEDRLVVLIWVHRPRSG
jgi:hypothetical protein